MKRINVISASGVMIASGVATEDDLLKAVEVAAEAASLFEGAKVEIVDGDVKTLIDDIRKFKEELDKVAEDDYSEDWDEDDYDDDWDEYDDDDYDDAYQEGFNEGYSKAKEELNESIGRAINAWKS